MTMNQEMAGMLCLIIGVVLAVCLLIVIIYLQTLQKALSRVSPRNRLMEPGLVWLLLIPCFNIIWQFFIAIRVPGSLQNEFRDRGRDDGSDYGKSIAMTNAILGIVGGVISNILIRSRDTAEIGLYLSGGLSIINLVLFIIFWVKIAGYSNQLAMEEGGRRDLDYDPDDEKFDRRSPPSEGPSTPPGAIQPERPDQYS